ncbi:MAG: alpha/beta fold hydrolase [Longimicrobiales bacterium]
MERLIRSGCLAAVVVFQAALPVFGQVPSASISTVDVRGAAVRVLTRGVAAREPGRPVLLLQAGAGSPIESWGEFLERVSELAPVVTFDRPGIGQSSLVGVGMHPEQAAEHAHEVMEVIGVPPPYILVGHSWGGALILYYADRYPEEVVGLVYLDPTEPRLPSWTYVLANSASEYVEREAEFDEALQSLNLPPGRQAEQDRILAFRRTPLDERGVPGDGDVPTAIVLGGAPPALTGTAPSYIDASYLRAAMDGRMDRLAAWARGRPETILILATDAGHFVHRDQPGLAAEAVHWVVSAVSPVR